MHSRYATKMIRDNSPEGATDQRLIGTYDQGCQGPTLVCLGGVHGNEPAGIHAAKRVFETLTKRRIPIRGRMVGLIGNVEALRQGVRHVDVDFNRIWMSERISKLDIFKPNGHTSGATASVEDREQMGLLSSLHRVFDEADDEVFVLDMHTMSADGAPFALFGDTLPNRRFASGLHAPLILGLEEHIDGVVLDYVNSLGHVTVGIEGGRHEDPRSIDYIEAVIWLALVSAGMIREADAPEVAQARAAMTAISRDLPPVVEVCYRHPIEDGDAFQMTPGYRNFQAVRKGEVLAHDKNGPVRCPEDGYILLPFYQGLGNDGFFIGREVKVGWLKVSSVLRRMRLDAVVHWLPGVRRHPTLKDNLIVNRSRAKWYALEIFHLLGFRKRRVEGDTLVVGRRKPNLANGRRS
ncbi:MAG TPA: succinylglutamate desuccinylase/aspartoacylase family protein [Phycisphaerae bacterium]|nr:succinylglutamate desuccinylase/aspartoacylase family protein [Phycisphaerae bacterium]